MTVWPSALRAFRFCGAKSSGKAEEQETRRSTRTRAAR